MSLYLKTRLQTHGHPSCKIELFDNSSNSFRCSIRLIDSLQIRSAFQREFPLSFAGHLFFTEQDLAPPFFASAKNSEASGMIGPSSGAAGDVTEGQCQAVPSKRKIFDDLDIDSFCEEVCHTSRKRYLQELETPMELMASNEIITDATLFSPMSAEEAIEESPVARLEVLLVNGTNCTWTTVSELEQQQQQQQQQQQLQNLELLTPSLSASSSSSSSTSISSSVSSAEHHRQHTFQQAYIVEQTHYEPTATVSVNYWETVAEPAVSVAAPSVQQSKDTANSHHNHHQHQPQQQFEDQENGNLSWLLDFKLDSFIEAADDRTTVGSAMVKDNHCGKENAGRERFRKYRSQKSITIRRNQYN